VSCRGGADLGTTLASVGLCPLTAELARCATGAEEYDLITPVVIDVDEVSLPGRRGGERALSTFAANKFP